VRIAPPTIHHTYVDSLSLTTHRSLDSISKNFGPVRVDVLGKIAEAVLGGLKYLYLAHRIMHRDIKPSNVLVNSHGQIKLCDFGVSSELVNSVADTFVGTGTYMAPERIQGSPYTVKSDVWSVGLTLMELAIGKFPFSVGGENEEDGADDDDEAPGAPQGILDLLQQIVLEPAPKLPKSEAFPQILEDIIAKCLMKNPDERPTPQELYDTDPFLQAAKRTPVDLEQWAIGMMERHNRKSHLVPQLSPGTKALLRGEETPQSSQSQLSASTGGYERTPVSADIFISSASSNGSVASSSTPYSASGPGPGPGSGPMSGRPYPARTSSAQQQQQQQQSAYASPPPGAYSQGQMNLPYRQAPPASDRGGGVGGAMPGGGRSSRPGTAGSQASEGYRRATPAAVGRTGWVQ
jgi:mitogen-activated protein kinase kinase